MYSTRGWRRAFARDKAAKAIGERGKGFGIGVLAVKAFSHFLKEPGADEDDRQIQSGLNDLIAYHQFLRRNHSPLDKVTFVHAELEESEAFHHAREDQQRDQIGDKNAYNTLFGVAPIFSHVPEGSKISSKAVSIPAANVVCPEVCDNQIEAGMADLRRVKE